MLILNYFNNFQLEIFFGFGGLAFLTFQSSCEAKCWFELCRVYFAASCCRQCSVWAPAGVKNLSSLPPVFKVAVWFHEDFSVYLAASQCATVLWYVTTAVTIGSISKMLWLFTIGSNCSSAQKGQPRSWECFFKEMESNEEKNSLEQFSIRSKLFTKQWTLWSWTRHPWTFLSHSGIADSWEIFQKSKVMSTFLAAEFVCKTVKWKILKTKKYLCLGQLQSRVVIQTKIKMVKSKVFKA